MSSGADQIRAERGRQIVTEGYSASNDEHLDETDLPNAAASYIESAVRAMVPLHTDEPPRYWPWSAASWKPTFDVKRDLVKAGALIAAAIDKIDAERAAAQPLDTRGFHFGSIPEPEAPLTEGA